MSTGRNNTPAWVPHLMGALLTVGATWTAIRTEVPALVASAVQLEVGTMTARMMARQDSAWTAAQMQLHQRIEHEAAAVRDSLQATLNLVRMGEGRVTYAPNITVEADTSGLKAMHDLSAKLDSIMDLNMRLLQRVQAQQPAKQKRVTWPR